MADGQSHPAMIIGVSDGGAHLDRDDGSDWSTAFLAFWVRDRKLWSLEEGIRQLTQVPAALLGFEGRGRAPPRALGRRLHLRPRHHRARVQEAGERLPRRRGARSRPAPGHRRWTIVNGVPIVRNGEVLTGNLPGHVVRPGVP